MKRWIPNALRTLVATITLGAMVPPSLGWAGTPYSVNWVFKQENPACEHARLNENGGPYFHVNGTPLPTYEVPGAFMTLADGAEVNTAEAGFDAVLLNIGANRFDFGAVNSSGDDSCVHAHNVVRLLSVPLGIDKPLFDVRRDGTAFMGTSQISLRLEEINPQLAHDIKIMEAEIADERAWLIDHAAQTAALAARLSLLQQLDTELQDLVSRPLDEIDKEDLDAILDRYAEVVDDATKAALEQLLRDLKQSVLDLENELASLIDNFGAQADAMVDLVTQSARAAGFNPDDPANYALGPMDVPAVEIPDISEVPGAFTPGNDPYAAYADKVIAALADAVSAGVVVDRAGFLTHVRAWRANQAALQTALAMRPNASKEEKNAFLNAQNLVTSYLHQFMDASDWFLDSPVPADVRAYVDGVLKTAFGVLAEDMKERLSVLSADTVDLTQTELFQTIRAFGGAMSAIGAGASAYVDTMQSLVFASTRIGIGFVPYVGPALDLCECVTGKAWCLPDGEVLSDEQRIFSGLGVAVGAVGKFWGGAAGTGIPSTGKTVAQKVASLDEELALLLKASRRSWYKTLRGAVTSKPIEPFERDAALHLLKKEGRALVGVGDDGVRKVLGIPKDAAGDLAKAPDFLSVTKGNKLALSEAKHIESGKIDAGEAIKQLTNAMKKATETGLAGDVERVELIMPKGASLKDNDMKIATDGFLVRISTGERFTLKGFKNFILVIQI